MSVGTFHDDKHELHGITIVVDTGGPSVYIGRCDDLNEHEVILNDADLHEGDTASKEAYVQKAARFGIWKKFDRISIPARDIATVRRLGEIAGSGS